MNFQLGFALRVIAAILVILGFIDDLGSNLDHLNDPDLDAMREHVGLLGLHGSFYFVQKITITSVCLYMIFSAIELKRNAWIIAFAAIIIIYNPVFPLDIDRMLWLAADFVSSVFFIISLVTFKSVNNRKNDPRKMKLPYLHKPPRF